jgi:hypothetical protein
MSLCQSRIVFFIMAAFHLVIQNADAQIRISGRVLDSNGDLPIPSAIVYVPESSVWTESDSSGNYSLVWSGRLPILLRASKLGFESSEYRIERQTGAVVQHFSLKPLSSKEVEVRARKQSDESIIRERADAFVLMPSASGNIESILPSIGLGVRFSAGGELSSQYSVRGGSYDENLVFVNDFEILRPQLIRNGQQEGLSFPNPDLIRDLSFSSGGFEARYGDKQSSVLDIRYKIPDSLRGSFSASLLGLQAHLEGSRSLFSRKGIKNFRYLTGFRYKTNQYLLNSLDVQGEYQPHFYDFQTFLSYDLSPSWQWNWIGNINASRFSLVPESGSQAKGNLFFILRLNTFYEGMESDYFNQFMTGTSLSYFPKNRKNLFYLKWISSLYRGQEAEQFDVIGYYRLSEIESDQKDPEGREVRLWGEGIQQVYGRNYLDNLVHHHELRGGWEFEIPGLGQKHLLNYGINLRQEFFLDRIREWERIDSAGYSLPYREDTIELNSFVNSENRFDNLKTALWIQDQTSFNLSSKWSGGITGGLRAHYNQLNHEFLLNPRMRIELAPKDHPQNLRLWVSGGLYPQVAFYRELRRPDGSLNRSLKAQKSWHLIMGWKKDFLWKKVSPTRFRWISEIYYKSLHDMVSYNLDNVRIRYSGENDSEGYALGWDNRIHGEFVPGVESWVNLSILRTRERLYGIQHLLPGASEEESKPVRDVPRPTDQLMSLSMFFQDFLPGRPKFKMHLQGTIASGIPFGFRTENLVYRNIYRFKTYHRVDIGFSYSIWERGRDNGYRSKLGHWLSHTQRVWISAEVYNLLNTKNEASVRWIKAFNNYEFSLPNYLTSRRINLRLRIEF